MTKTVKAQGRDHSLRKFVCEIIYLKGPKSYRHADFTSSVGTSHHLLQCLCFRLLIGLFNLKRREYKNDKNNRNELLSSERWIVFHGN